MEMGGRGAESGAAWSRPPAAPPLWGAAHLTADFGTEDHRHLNILWKTATPLQIWESSGCGSTLWQVPAAPGESHELPGESPELNEF